MTTARPKAITRPPKRSEPRAARQHRQHRAPARPRADGRPSAHVPLPELRAPVMKTGGARGLRGPAARTSSAGGTASQPPPNRATALQERGSQPRLGPRGGASAGLTFPPAGSASPPAPA